jgi:hypothetical protein
MPATSKAQRRLFALALQYKRGELSASDVSDEVKELSELPKKTLRDYAKTKESDLPDKVKEMLNLNPNVNVQGMGDVSSPGDPGTLNQFAAQEVGSGDIAFPIPDEEEEEEEEKKKLIRDIAPKKLKYIKEFEDYGNS